MKPLVALLMLAALVPGAPAAESARPSPAYNMQRVDATAISLSQYRGKVVVLAFIHTTCSHCQQLTTDMIPLAKEYAPRGVQFLECAFNDDAMAALPEFLQRFSPPFPVGYGSTASVLAYLQRTLTDPRPMYVPQIVFLDRAGVIRGEFSADEPFFVDAPASIRTQLEKMLTIARTAPAKAPSKKK